MTHSVLSEIYENQKLMKNAENMLTYWTFPMAHSDVTLNIKRGSTGESESFHMSIDQSVIHLVCRSPSALES